MAGKQVISTDDKLDLGTFMQAPVSPAVRANGFVFVSGYVPLNPETGKAELGSIEVQARRTLENIKLVLDKAGSSLEKVVKVNIFISEGRTSKGSTRSTESTSRRIFQRGERSFESHWRFSR